mmetsp:Transcript_20390/g.37152  ORF Transcript_20390/g.37152 Transcript_20390/m.37152 type:complete len:233 (+) Transcript_20390:499-1197(+)
MNHNILPITDTTLNSPRTVGPRSCCTRFWINIKLIIMLYSRQQSPSESISRFKTFRCRNGHTCLGQICLEFVKNGRSETSRDISCHARDHSTDGISTFADLVNTCQHLLSRGLIGAPDNVRVDVLHGERILINIFGLNILHFGNIRQNLDTVVHFENLTRNGTGGDASNGLTRRGTPSTGNRANTILGIIGSIRMTGAVCNVHIIIEVVSAPLILVADDHGNWRAERDILRI